MPVYIAGGILAIIIFLVLGKKAALAANPIYKKFDAEIRKASNRWNVPPELIAAVIEQESSGNPEAVGGSAEVGLMQLKPGQLIVDLYRVGMAASSSPSFEPQINIDQGTAGLRLLKDLTGNWFDALRAYNCCGTNISRVKSNPELSAGYAKSVLEMARQNGYTG